MVEHSEPDIKNVSVTEEKDVERFETVSFGKANSQGAERGKKSQNILQRRRQKKKKRCFGKAW